MKFQTNNKKVFVYFNKFQYLLHIETKMNLFIVFMI